MRKKEEILAEFRETVDSKLPLEVQCDIRDQLERIADKMDRSDDIPPEWRKEAFPDEPDNR